MRLVWLQAQLVWSAMANMTLYAAGDGAGGGGRTLRTAGVMPLGSGTISLPEYLCGATAHTRALVRGRCGSAQPCKPAQTVEPILYTHKH